MIAVRCQPTTGSQSQFAPSQTYLQITDCARVLVVRPASVSAVAGAVGGCGCFLLTEASRSATTSWLDWQLGLDLADELGPPDCGPNSTIFNHDSEAAAAAAVASDRLWAAVSINNLHDAVLHCQKALVYPGHWTTCYRPRSRSDYTPGQKSKHYHNVMTVCKEHLLKQK